MNIAEAKIHVRIPHLWRHFGFDGEAKTSCSCPWREDAHASFSVSAEGHLWHDFATGEGGDAVDFLQRASGLTKKEACRKFLELAGRTFTSTQRTATPPPTREAKPRPNFPAYRKGTTLDLTELARLRGIGREGIDFASERGVLFFDTLKDLPAWIITDSERVNAQARRMDGKQWEHIEAKAWTAPGSWASWPIGIKESQPFPAIALCEGGPDFIAGHYLALWEQASHYAQRDVQCVPVAMLGASLRIHEDALPIFEEKRVRIFGHADDAGRVASECWARQLETVGADVDAFDFSGLVKLDGSPAKDLNDCLNLNREGFNEVGNLMPC